jgi:5-methylcytosine-specific restriction enzyme B
MTSLIHPKLAAELNTLQESLTAEGELIPRERLQGYYDTFRREFGPEVLRGLDGLELLERMHAHGGQQSMVYWLEFKNDDEFPAKFGSIAGGSALKFRVYRRKETGTWARGGNGPVPRDITVDEAITIARSHRDQLVAACHVVNAMSRNGGDDDYLQLQRKLEEVAPAVQDTAWGHKYLSLMFPDVLDDYHVASYQQYHLIRMLLLPPEWADRRSLRYVCGGRYVALAGELDVPLNHLTTMMNHLHGSPLRYWRLGLQQDGPGRRSQWQLMKDGSMAAIGWSAAGDLSELTRKEKEELTARLESSGGMTRDEAGRASTQLLKFVLEAKEEDRVLYSDGQSILAVAEIAGGYSFDADSPLPHQRPVKWLSLKEWRAVDAEPLKTRWGATHDMRNHVEAERAILEADSAPIISVPAKRTPLGRTFTGVAGQLQAVLERKGQAILYGPPGTGKTYWAIRAARDLAALKCFGQGYAELDEPRRQAISEGTSEIPAVVRTCSFHPEYGYEDFIEGYRPQAGADGVLSFVLRPGAFLRLCQDAAGHRDLNFYLIIDEINRGDVPRIFGELLTLLERDKRDHPVVLPASGRTFRVPPNVFVIGTMNTADRSIALLDVALRRRFGFVELMPDYAVLKGAVIAGLPLDAWLENLNGRVRRLGGGDARHRQIGHAFLLEKGQPISREGQFAAVLRDDIVPLLEEYCYDDFGQLVELLGNTLVDATNQRIRHELFSADRHADLIGGLMRPEITTASAAVSVHDEMSGEGDSDGDAGVTEDSDGN